jgi:hypothetical protein
MKHGMYLYPWDLEDEGPDAVIGRLRDAGIDSLMVATSYHAGKFVRPHAAGRKVYFPEDGTVYFRPDASRYGRIKPRTNSRVGQFDALDALAKHAPDMPVTGWTVGLHNTPQGQTHPDLVVRNAYGDPLWNALCPAQPEVRRYLISLCADLAHNHPVAEVAIETPGWQAYRHGHHHEFELIDLTPGAQVLLGLCFCEACVRGAAQAGIDAAALARRAREELDRFFADGTEPTDPLGDPEWSAFLSWRAGVVSGLVAEVRDAMPNHIGLAIIPTTQSPNSLCWIEGSDLAALAKIARLEVPAYQSGVPAILSDVEATRAAAGAGAQLGYILRPTYPNLPSAEDVRTVVREIGATGAASISFYNYGHLRLSALDWIKSAIN